MTTALNDPGEPHTDRSYWSRLTATPMRDLIRGRATGRLDTDRLIEAADLPASVGDTVRRVVRRTRLWRLEKVDVARELIAHFRDALQAGAAPARALSDFGDERQAARLIRRAKRRGRPLMWHVSRRALQAAGGVLALVLVVYAGFAIRYWGARPKVTRDYIADVNVKALAVPREQAAWPVYREALLSVSIPPELWRKNGFDWKPGEPGWDQTAKVVESNSGPIARLRDAAARPGLGFLASSRVAPEDRPLFPDVADAPQTRRSQGAPPVISLLYHDLTALRHAALLLQADARVALIERDASRVTADIIAIVGVARHAREHGLIIGDLVSLSVLSLGANLAGECLRAEPALLSVDALGEISASLEAFADGEPWVRLDGERLAFADFVQRVYTDDGSGDGVFSLLGLVREGFGGEFSEAGGIAADLAAPLSAAVTAGRKSTLREYARLMDMVELEREAPLWRRGPSPVDQEIEELISGRTLLWSRHPLIGILTPALSRATAQARLCEQIRDAVTVAIALECFRRERNTYPASLSELVPEFLSALPPDQYDGQPIKYRVTDDRGPLLYSVGNDREDNGGRLRLTIDGRPDNENPMRWMPPGGVPAGPGGRPLAKEPAIGADWILYPPVRTPPRMPDDEAEAPSPSAPAQPIGG